MSTLEDFQHIRAIHQDMLIISTSAVFTVDKWLISVGSRYQAETFLLYRYTLKTHFELLPWQQNHRRYLAGFGSTEK